MSDSMADRVALKDRILEAALVHAAFEGWGRRTLLDAAADVGVDAADARRLFPQGGDSLVAWLDDWADRRMLAAVDPTRLAAMPVRQRITTLVRARLEALAEHKEAMRRAVLARGMPGRWIAGGRGLWRTLDRIWAAAGFAQGRREGIGYYSRRVTLAGVLVTTFLYWLEDTSEGHADSWAFLERRVEDVMRIGQARGRLQGMLQSLPGMGSGRRRRAAARS